MLPIVMLQDSPPSLHLIFFTVLPVLLFRSETSSPTITAIFVCDLSSEKSTRRYLDHRSVMVSMYHAPPIEVCLIGVQRSITSMSNTFKLPLSDAGKADVWSSLCSNACSRISPEIFFLSISDPFLVAHTPSSHSHAPTFCATS
jgi:hypothetical protein